MTNCLNFMAGTGGLALLGLGSAPVWGQQGTCKWTSPAERMIVAELYTSEGCSSCPPADRWLSSQLTTPERSSSILALSFHVDYWNYIGWEDPYSKKQFTERQYAHKRAGNVSQIYTPQYVFSNREVRRWGQAGLIPQRLSAMQQDKAPVGLQVSLERKAANQVEIQVFRHTLPADWNQSNVGLGVIVENNESNTVLQALNAPKALSQCS